MVVVVVVVVRTKNNMNIEGKQAEPSHKQHRYINMHNRNCIMTINYKTYVVRLIYSSEEHKKTRTTWLSKGHPGQANTIIIIIIVIVIFPETTLCVSPPWS